MVGTFASAQTVVYTYPTETAPEVKSAPAIEQKTEAKAPDTAKTIVVRVNQQTHQAE